MAQRLTVCVKGDLANSDFTVIRNASDVTLGLISFSTAEILTVRYGLSVISVVLGFILIPLVTKFADAYCV